jgi:hypothetical protein
VITLFSVFMPQQRIKVTIQRRASIRNKFPNYHMDILLGDFSPKVRVGKVKK